VEMKAKILVVDDDALTRKVVKLLLEDAGFEVVTCGNGSKAIETAAAELPTLVLQDQRLPDVTGIELAKRIRRLPGAESIPILALTGAEPSDEDAKLFQRILLKPIDPTVLVEAVRSHAKMR
jgi:CheY-like chemotaxis protein